MLRIYPVRNITLFKESLHVVGVNDCQQGCSSDSALHWNNYLLFFFKFVRKEMNKVLSQLLPKYPLTLI